MKTSPPRFCYNSDVIKKIIYTDHLLARINFRGVPKNLPAQIYRTADSYYFDAETNLFLAVKNVALGKNRRKFVLAFEIKDDIVHLVTIHPIKKNQEDRIKTGRWQKTTLKI